MTRRRSRFAALVAAAVASTAAAITSPAGAAVGDPQVKTDHPWYPGELACSTFDRLFDTQSALYKRVTGRDTKTDEDKALAAWLWRNTHYAHAEEGKQDCFGGGFEKGDRSSDYWAGLYAHGFALCGTTHSQWTVEMNALLGHCRGRTVGVSGHNSFEVFLTGGAYGAGRWALLDHDVSTVIFADDGSRLLSIQEIAQDPKKYTDPKYKPERQRGWRVSGLHDGDAKGVFDSFRSAEYLAGYAGAPPVVELRAGESLRRYLEPGLEDGKTFAFWGMNYEPNGTPGLTRDRTWVNQPDKMYKSTNGTGSRPGQARFGNAVYDYAPDFAGGKYKEAVVDEGPDHVTFSFRTPFVIASTPAGTEKWGVYKPGGRNGLRVSGNTPTTVSVSVDHGKTWHDAGGLLGALDLTDQVKGHNQYWLRFNAPASALAGAKVAWRTVCQVNPAVLPRLTDGPNTVTYQSTGVGIVSAGPNKAEAEPHVVDGAMGGKTVTLELKAPAGGKPVRVYAAGWVASGNPPDTKTAYAVDLSTDGGKTWVPVVKDWKIVRRAPEPADFWSQSFVYGDAAVPAGATGPVRVRFTNTGGKQFRKAEAHLAYEVPNPTPVEVTFAWAEGNGPVKTASHTYAPAGGKADAGWTFDAGKNVRTKWVEFKAK
ncbi:MAG TPA: hypothetical protein VF796_18225 [Humisphaera sp.]